MRTRKYIVYRLDLKKRQVGDSSIRGANFKTSDLPGQGSGVVSRAARGAGIGSAVGSVIPVGGTVLGGILGGLGAIGGAIFGGGDRVTVVEVIRGMLTDALANANARTGPRGEVTIDAELDPQAALQLVKETNRNLAQESGGSYDSGEARQFNGFVEVSDRPIGEPILSFQRPAPVTPPPTDSTQANVSTLQPALSIAAVLAVAGIVLTQ